MYRLQQPTAVRIGPSDSPGAPRPPDVYSTAAPVLYAVVAFACIALGARWQARDATNNLKVTFFSAFVFFCVLYGGVYTLSVASARARGWTRPHVAAVVVTATAWLCVWPLLWMIILSLSAATPVGTPGPDDERLVVEPSSDLARTVNATSVAECRSLIRCERSVAHGIYTRQMERRAACEKCLDSGMCPHVDGSGVVRCAPGACTARCNSDALQRRLADRGRCPNALAYSIARPDRSALDLSAACADDRGLCWYGCDAAASADGRCTTGWRGYEPDRRWGERLDAVPMDAGYPSEASCLAHHPACRSLGCKGTPDGVSRPSDLNCYCGDTYAPVGAPPCAYAAARCDKTSPQYAAASASQNITIASDEVRAIDEGEVAEGALRVDAEFSNLLAF